MLGLVLVCAAVGQGPAGEEKLPYIPAGKWVATSQNVAEVMIAEPGKLEALKRSKKVFVPPSNRSVEILGEKNGVVAVQSGFDFGYVPKDHIAYESVEAREEREIASGRGPEPGTVDQRGRIRWKVEYNDVEDYTSAIAHLPDWRFDERGGGLSVLVILIGKGTEPKEMDASVVLTYRGDEWRFLRLKNGIRTIDASFLVNEDARFSKALEYDSEVLVGGIRESMSWKHRTNTELDHIARSDRAVIQIAGYRHTLSVQDRDLLRQVAEAMADPAPLLKLVKK